MGQGRIENMFWTRLASGIVLVILAIGTLWVGGWLTCAVMGLLSLVGCFELLRVYGLEKRLMGIACYLTTILYYVVLYLDLKDLIMPVMVIYLLLILAIYVLNFSGYKDKDAMAAFLAFYYVSVCLSYVFRLRSIKDGGFMIILVFVCSWGNDTLAYVTGRLFGKHKMSPVLSPKKSVEGLIGGIIGTGILGAVFGILFNSYVQSLSYAPLWFALVAAVGAVPAVIGDLAASAIKRNNDVKDYGKLIPGHGGVLDRFDSMIFTAPIIFYAVQFVLGNAS